MLSVELTCRPLLPAPGHTQGPARVSPLRHPCVLHRRALALALVAMSLCSSTPRHLLTASLAFPQHLPASADVLAPAEGGDGQGPGEGAPALPSLGAEDVPSLGKGSCQNGILCSGQGPRWSAGPARRAFGGCGFDFAAQESPGAWSEEPCLLSCQHPEHPRGQRAT